MEKILNKRKIIEVEKYLICWKGFTAEHDVKIIDGGLYFIFSFHFYFTFSFFFFFSFLFLEQLRLGLISHAVTSVTN